MVIRSDVGTSILGADNKIDVVVLKRHDFSRDARARGVSVQQIGECVVAKCDRHRGSLIPVCDGELSGAQFNIG